jgi:uncharacterized phage protein (TIGR01671 family)
MKGTMREIKFRGISTYDKRFVYGFYVNDKTLDDSDPSNHNIWSNDGDGSWNDIDPDTLGQYTGLKDKNGKEIYEGDVVEFFGRRAYGDDVGFEDYTIRAKVVFIPSTGFSLRFLSGRWDFDDSEMEDVKGRRGYITASRTKVIGNIHENPELLK